MAQTLSFDLYFIHLKVYHQISLIFGNLRAGLLELLLM